jgi:hypothetical protein
MMSEPKVEANDKEIVVTITGGELTAGSLRTLERFAWLRGKTVVVMQDGKQLDLNTIRDAGNEGE